GNMKENLFSIVGTEPVKVSKYNLTEDLKYHQDNDPLKQLEQELSQFGVPEEYRLKPSIANGGAIGYIGYECVKYFEPKVGNQSSQKDALQIPEACMMLSTSFIIFEHVKDSIRIVVLCPLEQESIEQNYEKSKSRMIELYNRMFSKDKI